MPPTRCGAQAAARAGRAVARGRRGAATVATVPAALRGRATEPRPDDLHYGRVPATYHEAFFYAKGSVYEKWQLGLVGDALAAAQPAASARLVDVGGGTGRFAHLLQARLALTELALCVDPSKAMLELAAALPGVETQCSDAVTFATEPSSEASFDICLLKECLHHVPTQQLVSLFDGLHNGLRAGGIALVVTRPKQEIDYPFFHAAAQAWAASQPNPQVFAQAMRQGGLADVKMSMHACPVRLPFESWADMIRNRMWSTFSEDNFSDQEIEQGIDEIQRTCEDRLVGDHITFEERLVLIRGRKLG